MDEIAKCPKCSGEYVYFDGSLYACPDCGHEFNEEDGAAADAVEMVAMQNEMEAAAPEHTAPDRKSIN